MSETPDENSLTTAGSGAVLTANALREAANRYTAARIALLKARDGLEADFRAALVALEHDRPYRLFDREELLLRNTDLLDGQREVQKCLIEVMESEGELIAMNGLQVFVQAEPKR